MIGFDWGCEQQQASSSSSEAAKEKRKGGGEKVQAKLPGCDVM